MIEFFVNLLSNFYDRIIKYFFNSFLVHVLKMINVYDIILW